MKFKMFAIMALMCVSTLAAAQSVTIGYAHRAPEVGEQEHLTSLSVKTKQYGAFTGDVGVSTVQKDVSNAITNRYELGVTYKQPLTTVFSGDLRLATGWKAKSGSDTTTYYVVEPSVTAKVFNTPASVKLGYRIREAYNSAVEDNSKTTRLAVNYAVTDKDSVSLGRDWQRGDGAQIQTTVQYTRSF